MQSVREFAIGVPSSRSSTYATWPLSSRAPVSRTQPCTKLLKNDTGNAWPVGPGGKHGDGQTFGGGADVNDGWQFREALSSGKSIRPNGARLAPLLLIWTVRVP